MEVYLKTHNFNHNKNMLQKNYDKFNESFQLSLKNKFKKENKIRKKREKRQKQSFIKKIEEKKKNYIVKILKKFSNESKNLSNMNNKRNSNSEEKNTKLTLFKENDSDYTTSFATNCNLTPKIEKNYNINSSKNNDMNLILNSNNTDSINDKTKIYDTNLNSHKLKEQKREENIIFFPNDLKTTKKNNKKKKKNNKNNKMINNLENEKFENYNNDTLNPYVNEQIGNNNYLKYNNTIYTNPNIINNYKISNINNNNNIVKNDNNFYTNLFDNYYYYQNNNRKSKIESNKNVNNNIEKPQNLNYNMTKNPEEKNKKKYIYMSDILSCPPIRINPKCSTPFMIDNNNRNKNNILLNIKIKLPNSNNFIEIPLRDNDNPISLINKLNMDLSVIEKYIIYEKIENSINFIKHFNDLIISYNNKNFYELNNFIINHNSYINKKDGI